MTLSKETIQHLLTLTVPERKAWLQADVLREWNTTGCNGTFVGGTGVGKTRTGLLAIGKEVHDAAPEFTAPKIVLAVPTETLRDVDWPDEFKKWGYEHHLPLVKRVCWKSLSKLKDGPVDLFVGDEFHHLTPASFDWLARNRPSRILGLTATLPENDTEADTDKRRMINLLAPEFYNVSLEDGIDLGIIADFDVKVLLMDLDNSCKYITAGTAKQPFMTTEASHYLYLTKQLQRATFTKNEAFKMVAMQRRTDFLYNLRSKTQLAKEVMQSMISPGQRTLIFCGSIAQSIELCGKDIYNSGTDDLKLRDFQAKRINTLGAVQALDEGKNIDDLDQSLIVQINSKARRLVQRTGRNVRWREGHKALIVILVARATADEKWYRNSAKGIHKRHIKEYSVKLQNPLTI